MASCGDVPGLETLAAVSILREHLPDLDIRVVTVVGEDNVAGQQPLMIEQQMQLHGALGALVLRPVEEGGTQLDQREQLVLEAKPVVTRTLNAGRR